MPQRYRHDPSKSLVGCMVGDVHYAVHVGAVHEIIIPLPLVELPHARRAVVGVADFRGDLVPVIDLRTRFGLPPVARTRKTKWIVVDVANRMAALVVDSVTEVFGTGGVEIRDVPPLGDGEDVRGISGATTFANTLVFVLDTSKLYELIEPIAPGRPDRALASSRVGSQRPA